MLLLLPPSETKREPRRSRAAVVDWESLSRPGLTQARRRVAEVLDQVSRTPDAEATLGVPAGVAHQIAWNLRLTSSPALPALGMYAGVLYDALDAGSLDAAARRRAMRELVIFSPLYGVIGAGDRVRPYRVHPCARLPELGEIAHWWRVPLGEHFAPPARGLILDCRSGTYAGMWRPAGAEARWVRVLVPGASHDAKRVRGLIARSVLSAGAAPRRPEELVDLLAPEYDVALNPPERPAHPIALYVRER